MRTKVDWRTTALGRASDTIADERCSFSEGEGGPYTDNAGLSFDATVISFREVFSDEQ